MCFVRLGFRGLLCRVSGFAAQGILVLHMEALRGCLNMKVFVDTDDDLRLARRCAGTAVPKALADLHFSYDVLHVTAASKRRAAKGTFTCARAADLWGIA